MYAAFDVLHAQDELQSALNAKNYKDLRATSHYFKEWVDTQEFPKFKHRIMLDMDDYVMYMASKMLSAGGSIFVAKRDTYYMHMKVHMSCENAWYDYELKEMINNKNSNYYEIITPFETKRSIEKHFNFLDRNEMAIYIQPLVNYANASMLMNKKRKIITLDFTGQGRYLFIQLGLEKII
jgi:hypothetical protein